MAPVDPEAKISAELEVLADVLALGEKEETWDKMEKALIRFAGVTRGGGYKHLPLYTEGMGRKGCASKVAECMLSDRGRLSTAAVELLQAFAPRLGLNFAPIVQPYFESLLKLFARPNKVFLKRSERCLVKIIENCQLSNIVFELRKGLIDDAATCRRICSAGIERAINEWETHVWTDKSLACLEESLRKMATDKDAEVRQTGKRVWARFMELWPERVDAFSAPLTPTIRRYLNLPAGGGPAKVKSKPIPLTRPAHPAPAGSSSSASTHHTSSTNDAGSRPQSQRVAALTHKSSRVALRPPPQAETRQIAPTAPNQPSPPKATSRKVSANSGRGDPLSGSVAQPVASSSSTQLDLPPLHPARSASYAVLPTVSSFSSLVDKNTTRSHRPALIQSFSTTALSSEGGTSHSLFAYTGRFATGPVRLARPPPPTILDEPDVAAATLSGEQLPFTPIGTAVYGGPARPPRAPGPPHVDIGHNRRPLGGAQRRVVTAPLETGLGMPVKTPAAAKQLSRSVRGRDKEEQAAPADSTTTVELGTNTPAQLPTLSIVATPPRSAPTPSEPFVFDNIETAAAVPSSPPVEARAIPVTLPTTPAVGEGPQKMEMLYIASNVEIAEFRNTDGPIPVEIAARIPLPSDEVAVHECVDNLHVLEPVNSVDEAEDEEVDEVKDTGKDSTVTEAVTQENVESAPEEELALPPATVDVAPRELAPITNELHPETDQARTPHRSNTRVSETEQEDVSVDLKERFVLSPVANNAAEQPVPKPTEMTVEVVQSPAPVSLSRVPAPNVDAVPATSTSSVNSAEKAKLAIEVETTQPASGMLASIPGVHDTSVDQTPMRAASITEAPRSESTTSTEPKDAEPVLPIPPVAATASAAAKAPKLVAKAAPPVSKPAPISAAVARKPAVPRAADLGRRPVERKAFRPITAAQTAAAASATALAKTKEVARPLVKPAALPTAHPPGIAKQPRVASTSSTSSIISRDKPVSTNGPPAPRPAKPSSLLAPTKASAIRAASNTHAKTVSGPTAATASSSTSSALPPVRKERVKLKPALPSFRPTRSGAAATNVTAQAQVQARSTAPTSRSTSSANNRRSVARVKPESIPLPRSPADKAVPVKEGESSSPLSKGSNASSGRIRVRPENVALPASPMTKVSGGPTQAERVPLPLSPVVTFEANSEDVHPVESYSAPVYPTSLPLPASPTLTTACLDGSASTQQASPAIVAMRFESTLTPLRPASAAQTASQADSDSEDDDNDDLTGVTFKVRTDDTIVANRMNRPKVVQAPSTGDLKGLSGVDKLTGSTTPRYTPGRKALVKRDANVRSPSVLLASASQGVGDEW